MIFVSKSKTIVTKQTDHALEEVFDIAPGTTVVEYTEQTTILVASPIYDEKDSEIENDYQEVFDKAIAGHEKLQDEIEGMEGRYLPRMAEVSVQHLNVALNAASMKARMKEHKDKLVAKNNKAPTTVNNNLVIDRNELVSMLRKKEEEKSDGT